MDMPTSGKHVARMSAAICGDQDWFPDVASLIRATLATLAHDGGGMRRVDARAMGGSQGAAKAVAR